MADLRFVVHKLEKLSSNPGKVNVEGLVHFFKYIRDNKTLGLKYHAGNKYTSLPDLLIQTNI